MKVARNERIGRIFLTMTMVLALILGCLGANFSSSAAETKVKITTNKNMYVQYNSHVQDIGWEGDFSKTNGNTSGTTGRNLKVEAIKIRLINAPENVGITYQSYLKGIGWQNAVSNGAVSGTTGQNRKMEGIKISLTGTDAYSIQYRVHVQDTGWMNWVQDGAVAGVLDKGLKIEAIEIIVAPRTMSVMYKSHVENIGWAQYKNDGDTSGTIGLKIEAVRIQLRNSNIKIKYKTHVQDIGWEDTWKQDGTQSGTTGKNKKVEAIRIILDDTSNKYSVMYRVYLDGIGWQDWKKDGEEAGTTGQNRKMYALEVKIVEKQPSTEFSIKYQSYMQKTGWQGYVQKGDTSGVVNGGQRVEGIQIIGANIPTGVKIKYQSHIENVGWESTWKEAGEISGKAGSGLKIEAFKIKLEGTETYSIRYRTYIQGKGWQDWANDGEISGTTGQNRRIEAIEIEIVPRIKNNIKVNLDTNINPIAYPTSSYTMSGWLMTDINNVKIQVLINNKVTEATITRVARQDVLDAIKGYGGQDKNPTPGYKIVMDFNKLSVGNTNIKIQFVDASGKVLSQIERNTNLLHQIKYTEGTYGKSGQGRDLKYLKYGNGPNVFFATFAIHGYEDLWAQDGQELVTIANSFYNKLISDQDYGLSQKWTVYVFPGVNQDGLNITPKQGGTNNGPGRTTVASRIDLNRCWQIGSSFTRYTDSRNYNGTAGFQAAEAKALRDFFLSHKSANGQTLLVDLHGWTQQLIGDPTICSYYGQQFPENDKSSIGRYGTQYMIGWGRTYLASSSRAAKTALIELPNSGVTGHQAVVNKNFANRYISATMAMLKGIN